MVDFKKKIMTRNASDAHLLKLEPIDEVSEKKPKFIPT